MTLFLPENDLLDTRLFLSDCRWLYSMAHFLWIVSGNRATERLFILICFQLVREEESLFAGRANSVTKSADD